MLLESDYALQNKVKYSFQLTLYQHHQLQHRLSKGCVNNVDMWTNITQQLLTVYPEGQRQSELIHKKNIKHWFINN